MNLNTIVIPREKNQNIGALEVASNTFNTPTKIKLKHEVEMNYRYLVLDNTKHWQVFEYDQ